MRQGRSAPLPATDPNDRCEATHIRRLDVGVQARLRNTWLRRQLAGRRWEGVRPAVRVAACMRVRLGASQAALASPPPASQPSRIQDCGDRLIGLVDRIYSARYDGGVCPHSNQLCEIIVHFAFRRAALARHRSQRFPVLVGAVEDDRLEAFDLTQPSDVLRHDDVVAGLQVGSRPCCEQ